MELGVYTAILHDQPLPAALAVIRDLGLTGAEINSGGFLPAEHLPIDALLSGEASPRDYLRVFDDAGVRLTGLNCNGNPLHPDPRIGPAHARDLRRTIEVAGLLGVRRVVTMSGLPAAEPGGTVPGWNPMPFESTYSDARDRQWAEVGVPFWREIDALAAEHGVTVCIEMHQFNLVFNPGSFERLVERAGATNLGVEMDPSHLFWQGIDPVAAIEHLGGLVCHAAAKDTRINPAARIHGVLDDRHRRVADNPIRLGGDATLNAWPENAAWDFVALGKGHDQAFWTDFLRALSKIDPDMAVNIEHEDVELGQREGLEVAANVLRAAAADL
ncbi:MAG: sugar phosphate isomerase/epimerase [Pseudonocardia sp.]|nr:sugar phosphate isomerase/epimerase [Pseudonocardia sp.]